MLALWYGRVKATAEEGLTETHGGRANVSEQRNWTRDSERL